MSAHYIYIIRLHKVIEPQPSLRSAIAGFPQFKSLSISPTNDRMLRLTTSSQLTNEQWDLISVHGLIEGAIDHHIHPALR